MLHHFMKVSLEIYRVIQNEWRQIIKENFRFPLRYFSNVNAF